MRHPDSVRTASVLGRVRSWPRSLIAAASRTRPEAISRSEAANARSRLALPAARAMDQRRARFRATTRCMLMPIATDASPRASRPEATMTSWTELTPRPPSRAGPGAAAGPRGPRRRGVAGRPQALHALEGVAAVGVVDAGARGEVRGEPLGGRHEI